MRFKAIASLLLTLFFCFSCSTTQLTYDGKIKKLLDRKQLSYEIDKDGDFKVSVPLPNCEIGNPPCESVWIISSLKALEKLQIREIFSLCLQLPNEVPSTLLQSLMRDTYNNRFLGSWCILECRPNMRYLAYLAKFPTADVNTTNLMSILQEVAQSSYSMREILLSTSACSPMIELPEESS